MQADDNPRISCGKSCRQRIAAVLGSALVFALAVAAPAGASTGQLYAFGLKIEELPTNHASAARRRHQIMHDRASYGIRQPQCLRSVPGAARGQRHHD